MHWLVRVRPKYEVSIFNCFELVKRIPELQNVSRDQSQAPCGV